VGVPPTNENPPGGPALRAGARSDKKPQDSLTHTVWPYATPGQRLFCGFLCLRHMARRAVPPRGTLLPHSFSLPAFRRLLIVPGVYYVTMSLDSLDKCPLCGTPFMNALKPGENPKIRQCYTCEANATRDVDKRQITVDDELTLMPNEGENLGGPRQGRMSPRKSTRPTHLRPKFRR